LQVPTAYGAIDLLAATYGFAVQIYRDSKSR